MRILFITCCWLLALPLKAEIYDCNGIWTNKPCEQPAKKSLTETPPREHKEDPLANRRSWLQDLRTQSYKARHDHGIVVNIQSVEDMCLDIKFSTETCSQLIEAKEKDLNELMLKSKEVKAREARNKIEANKKPDTINVITRSENNIVTIVETPITATGASVSGATSSGVKITVNSPLDKKNIDHVSAPHSHEEPNKTKDQPFTAKHKKTTK